jgi:hypothetical protein
MVESICQSDLQLPFKQGHELGRAASITLDGISIVACPFESVERRTMKARSNKR